MNPFTRSERLIGTEAQLKLQQSRVAVFGAGGVGGAAIEALARSGIGTLDIIDGDRIVASNLNRQILATEGKVGMRKVEAAKMRIHSINPNANVHMYDIFFLPAVSYKIDFSAFDYVIDAFDTVTAKIEIISCAVDKHVPVISCMGTGNKLDPFAFRIDDIYKTRVCPLARVIRSELKKRKIQNVPVLYSEELPLAPILDIETEAKGIYGHPTPGSVPFVPPVAGFLIASHVVKSLIGIS